MNEVGSGSFRSNKSVSMKILDKADYFKHKIFSLYYYTYSKFIVFNSNEIDYCYDFSRNFGYLSSKFNLSNPDFDFLATGFTLCKFRGVTALVTNDFGIWNSGKEIIEKSFEDKIPFPDFYIRSHYPYFQKVFPNVISLKNNKQTN